VDAYIAPAAVQISPPTYLRSIFPPADPTSAMALVTTAVVSLAAAGCGSRTPLSSGPAPGDAGRDEVSEAGDGMGCVSVGNRGGACNSLAATGNPVPAECVAAPVPSPNGGTIADGIYVLERSRFYGGCPTVEADRIVWQVCGSSWQTEQEVTMGMNTEDRTIDATVQINPANATVAFDLTCAPNGTPNETVGYFATPTSLSLFIYQYGPGIVRVDDLARQ
jgi:hypothetical protein